jgi:selenide,water dikinase
MSNPIQLTQYTKSGGCGCKMGPLQLEEILKNLPKPHFPHLLAGNEHNEDAAVWKWDEETALIQTTDFFLPIVDDPYDFGSIAAANALSDVYAMGGKPLMALAIVGWPTSKIPLNHLHEVMRGAHDIAATAGIPIAGGHTIETEEPIFGLSVSGKIHPQHIKRNHQAQLGDLIYITKPLGIGILSTALKRGRISAEGMAPAIAGMKKLNVEGGLLGSLKEVHAMTDITGFGLVGHLMEMLQHSGLAAEIKKDQLPLYPLVKELAAENIYADMAMKTHARYQKEYTAAQLSDLIIGCDPQTSGGLLFTASADAPAILQDLAQEHGFEFIRIGEVVARQEQSIIWK